MIKVFTRYWPKQGFYVLMFLWLALLWAAPGSADDGPIKVMVEGVSGAQQENVKAALGLPPGIVREGQVEEHWLKRFVKKIPEKVQKALEPFGYYNSQCDVSMTRDDSGQYGIKVKVEPGPETTIRSLEISIIGEGSGNPKIVSAQRNFPLKAGDVLKHETYADGKLDLQLEANDEGYIEAKYLTHDIKVFPEENAADIILELDTGPRFFFGPVRFVDDSELFDKDFLKRYLTFREGDVFSHEALHRSRLNYYGANRFDEVLMVPLVDSAVDQKVPVEVKLVPGHMQRFRPGIGYGTDTKARVTFSYQHMNMLGRAHALVSDLYLAQQKQFFETSYKIPLAGSPQDNLIGTLGYYYEDNNTYENEIASIEAERAYGMGHGKTGSVYLRYFREDYEIGTDSGLAYMLMPGVRYYQRSYDEPINPKRGYQYRLELRGSYSDALSDVTLGQVLAGGSFIHPLSKRFTLHSRIQAAVTLKDDELSKVPASLRFFVGGDNSVRGYALKSRGPTDKNGDVIGGDSLLVGSVECEYALSDNWGLAVFYDVGSAYNAFSDITFIRGAGVGIRRYTPIGTIKLDLANRISESHHSVRVHFSVGFEI